MSKFTMPSLGSQMIEARLIRWRVKPGDKVKKGDVIGEIDTEKGLIDIEVFEDGVIKELVAEEGEVIPVGAVMAVIGDEKEEPRVEKKEISEKEEQQEEKEEMEEKKAVKEKVKEKKAPALKKKEKTSSKIKASPLAKKVAEDLHVDISKIKGSGRDGTIHKKDVEEYAELEKADETFEKEIDMAEHISAAESIGTMRQAIAGAMSKSNREIPHYYLETEIDMKAALDWLENENKNRSIKERLMPQMLFIKAVANALTSVPQLNGYWSDQSLHVQEGINIGFAISLRKGGLVIPALLNADLKTMEEIREDFIDLVMRAREGHLKSREVSSTTISITSLGEQGADKVYGVIYPPQVALVGLGKIRSKPSAIDGAVGIRPVISVVLAGDHRATDGHTGSRFLEILDNQLQHPQKL